MTFSFRQRIGALFIDAPRYIYFFLRKNAHDGHAWLLVRNRDENLELSHKPFGVKCQWLWTSDLYLPKVFPFFGRILFSKALKSFTFRLDDKKTVSASALEPCVSFIIGHRGATRSDLLLKTIESIAAQKNCSVECIVVEQDYQTVVKELLPTWVKYVFAPPKHENMAYSRAQAFNYGAQHASSDCLIFHDNDLLVPDSYAFETLKLVKKGYDFVNLKRFIFYLSDSASTRLITQSHIEASLSVENIMQNAEGGGSIGASREGYSRIGGFDERFIGWGGEDNEFWERAETTKVWSYGFLPLIHLWHKPQSEKLDTENSETASLFRELSQKNTLDRIKWLTQNQNPLSQDKTVETTVREID